MHEWQAALTGAIIVVTMLVAAPARAEKEKDAAMKVREGEINHWIEYYRRDREAAPTSATANRSHVKADEETEKRKEKREKP